MECKISGITPKMGDAANFVRARQKWDGYKKNTSCMNLRVSFFYRYRGVSS